MGTSGNSFGLHAYCLTGMSVSGGRSSFSPVVRKKKRNYATILRSFLPEID